MRAHVRRLAPAVAMTLALGVTTACARDRASVDFADAVGEPVVTSDDSSSASVAASRAAFETADVVFLGTADTSRRLADNSQDAHVPLLVAGDEDKITAELERLGASTVVVADGDLADLTDGYEVIEVDPEAKTTAMDLPSLDVDDDKARVTALVDPEAGHRLPDTVVKANVRAAGGRVITVPGGDPRATGETVDAVTSAKKTALVAVGASFRSAEVLAARAQTAMTAPQLPGGGQALFPGRRVIGLYGSPGVPSLGPLGDQGIDASISRAKELAKHYEPYSEVPVVPAFEIIVTVAASEPGPDGDYSTEIDPETVRPWIEAAAEAGVYVVIDLQPGTTDFLTQAKLYEDLLKEPHVGLALDPEWRLLPQQRHMEQIGSVGIEEVNETADWLARLTTENSLPQKAFLLHQFSPAMIRDRDHLDTTHDELAAIVHADGHGTPGLKMGTWQSLRQDLPDGVWLGWKNFYDEDTPTFTPEKTYEVEPRPWFVSYQ